jgi:hypothetical protein
LLLRLNITVKLHIIPCCRFVVDEMDDSGDRGFEQYLNDLATAEDCRRFARYLFSQSSYSRYTQISGVFPHRRCSAA